MHMARILKAAGAIAPPQIDGKLDDACWHTAEPITGFTQMHTDRKAEFQTSFQVCFDESNLYIACKCFKLFGVQPHGKVRPRDDYMFSDDIIEILLDPGRTQSRYYQFVINAYGSIYDTLRTAGGNRHDPRWSGDWKAAAHIQNDCWSLEAVIPYYNFAPLMGDSQKWGINICRESHTPYGQSSILPDGAFHTARQFAVLEGFEIDFDRYCIEIGSSFMRLASDGNNPVATLQIPITNHSKSRRHISVEKLDGKTENTGALPPIALDADAVTTVESEPLSIEPILPGRTDAFFIEAAPQIHQIIVRDADNDAILARSLIARPWFFDALNIDVEDAWQKQMPAEPSQEMKVQARLAIVEPDVQGGTLELELYPHDGAEAVARHVISNPSDSAAGVFSIAGLAWGAYIVRAAFVRSDGQVLCRSEAPATVLPDGKQRIKVLNNLVSELMNVQDRGLRGEGPIAFMNPRDGWVYFSITPEDLAVTLDDETEPLLSTIATVEHPAEAMRYLPAGRHVLHNTENAEGLIVRAVPELLYCEYPTAPGVDGYDVDLYVGLVNPPSQWTPSAGLGPHSWEFLSKDVLANCNVIAGQTNDEVHMKQWTDAGRRWISTTGGPGYHAFLPKDGLPVGAFADEDYCFNYWSGGQGFQHPLATGAIADDCSNAPDEQVIAWAKALRRIAAEPRFKGKTFYPWQAISFGTDATRAFLKMVFELGWRFAYYRYLPEQSSQQEAEALVEKDYINAIQACIAACPKSIRHMIPSPGIMSHPSMDMDVNPSANFKVHMELQLAAFANHSDLFGMYGLQWYYSSLADEESTRWGGRLFRHYGIEGKTEMLSNDPYELSHVKNPDFEQGTEHWTVENAEEGSVRIGSLPGYGSSLQGRYLGGSRGDTFAIMQRNSLRPNKISQSIENLELNRLYSIKMITANYHNMMHGISESLPDAVRLELASAQIIPGPRRNYCYTYPHNYGASLGNFNIDNRAYLNYHYYVFRPDATAIKLTISDWRTPQDPGGSVGQEIMVNFIEVQPYFE